MTGQGRLLFMPIKAKLAGKASTKVPENLLQSNFNKVAGSGFDELGDRSLTSG